jgi:hypothetical protein
MKSREWATLGVLAFAVVHGSTEPTERIPRGDSAEDALRYSGGHIGALLRETPPSAAAHHARGHLGSAGAVCHTFAQWLAGRGMAIPMMRGLPR